MNAAAAAAADGRRAPPSPGGGGGRIAALQRAVLDDLAESEAIGDRNAGYAGDRARARFR